MLNQVKEFIEHYVYLMEKGQIDMILYMAGKEFKTQREYKMHQLIDILNKIDIDTQAAQERLFIDAFKEAFEKLQNSNVMYNKMQFNQFLLVNMATRYGLSIVKCGELIEKIYPNNLKRTSRTSVADWILKW